MVLALGCAHQLPRIAPPAITSAKLGTGPRPDSSTTPLPFTKAMACFGVIRVLPRAAERHAHLPPGRERLYAAHGRPAPPSGQRCIETGRHLQTPPRNGSPATSKTSHEWILCCRHFFLSFAPR